MSKPLTPSASVTNRTLKVTHREADKIRLIKNFYPDSFAGRIYNLIFNKVK